LTHVSGGDEVDHVLKNYLQDAESSIEVATIRASDDFHVSNVNIDFALIHEVGVKASQTVNSSFAPIQQVSIIHYLSYVSVEQDGDYVSKMNMGIKQDRTPSVPSEPHQVGILPPKEAIHGNILWSNTSIGENLTIDPIVNAMTSTKVMLHILQQGPS
jgi:hypothetical protein